jgi:hypothetical protein
MLGKQNGGSLYNVLTRPVVSDFARAGRMLIEWVVPVAVLVRESEASFLA